jgi:hypothetical protein
MTPWSSNVRQPVSYSQPIMKSKDALLYLLASIADPYTDSLKNLQTLFTIHFNNNPPPTHRLSHVLLYAVFQTKLYLYCMVSQHFVSYRHLFLLALARLTCNFEILKSLPHHCVWTLHVSITIGHLQVSPVLLMKLLCSRR